MECSTASALAEDVKLAEYSGYIEDSGEGRWTIQAAVEEAVPADVLSAALYARFRSRQTHTFGEKLLSAMRKGFGGHIEPKAKCSPSLSLISPPVMSADFLTNSRRSMTNSGRVLHGVSPASTS